MNLPLAVLAGAVSLPGALTSVHLAVLGGASILYRSPERRSGTRTVRFMVVIPAHNEEAVIGETLDAIMADIESGDRVLVVADRCSDRTAEIAARAGALVLERTPDREPGRAAARQDGVRHSLSYDWDAMVMVDADSRIEPGFFDAVADAIAGGAEALQARSEAAVGPRLLDQINLASFSLQGVMMPRGRDRLGALVRLRGTGMVLVRRLVTEFEFRAAASEDLWYSLDLCLAGVRPRHVEAARLRSLNAPSWRAARTQKLRYEAGRLSAARTYALPLLRRHTVASVEAAVFLLTPPYALAAGLLSTGLGLALVAGSPTVAIASGAAIGLLVADVAVALLSSGAGIRTWAAMAAAPWYLPWKAAVQLRALLNVHRRVTTYGATPRT